MTRTERVRVRNQIRLLEWKNSFKPTPVHIQGKSVTIKREKPAAPIVDLTGKNVLVIGSGIDINGRKLKDDIDGGRWDYIIRVNRFYGKPEDVGTKTDLYFLSGERELRELNSKGNTAPVYVVAWHTDEKSLRPVQHEVRSTILSTGFRACYWASLSGASSVSIIGYGYRDGKWTDHKTYPNGRVQGLSVHYWYSENKYEAKHYTLID